MCFHIQRAEDKIGCPVIITTSAVIVMRMNMRLLLLLSLANELSLSPELPGMFLICFVIFLTIPSCFDMFSRELGKE